MISTKAKGSIFGKEVMNYRIQNRKQQVGKVNLSQIFKELTFQNEKFSSYPSDNEEPSTSQNDQHICTIETTLSRTASAMMPIIRLELLSILNEFSKYMELYKTIG